MYLLTQPSDLNVTLDPVQLSNHPQSLKRKRIKEELLIPADFIFSDTLFALPSLDYITESSHLANRPNSLQCREMLGQRKAANTISHKHYAWSSIKKFIEVIKLLKILVR